MSDHALVWLRPTPSGWKAGCACGHRCRGVNRAAALEAHADHRRNPDALPVAQVPVEDWETRR